MAKFPLRTPMKQTIGSGKPGMPSGGGNTIPTSKKGAPMSSPNK